MQQSVIQATTQVGLFLINIVFNFYVTLVLLRFLLQWVKADFYNPYCQFLIRLTNPFLVPLRRVIPGLFGIDLAAVILMLFLETLQIVLIALISGFAINGGLIVAVILDLVVLVLQVYFWAILIRALLSWINPDPSHPLIQILDQLTFPVLKLFRRVIPAIAGIDLSPLAALILIQVILIFIHALVG